MGNTEYKFKGWVGKDKDSIGKLVWEEYTPKTFEETDVDIQISYCGICASDLHTLRSGWGPTEYPQVVGHEIVGKVVKIGKDVKHLKMGDIVGVGAQSGSCLKCEYCNLGKEPYCDEGQIGTYAGRYRPSNEKSFGGYADYARVPSHFAFKIPAGLAPEIAAPMMCGGVTVFSPLKQLGAGPGKRIGIVGIGGLGHFGLMFAKALGAEPVAISHSESKKADAEKLGAVQFIATKDEDFATKNRRTLDGIVVTANNADMDLVQLQNLLKPGCKIIMVGAPEGPLTKPLHIFPFILNNTFVGGSAIGGSHDIKEMLELAVKVNVKTWIEVRDLKDVNNALIDMEAGKPRFRYVLKNTNHANL